MKDQKKGSVVMRMRKRKKTVKWSHRKSHHWY
jgi:hypothetical protein